jgi:hypothetical protein
MVELAIGLTIRPQSKTRRQAAGNAPRGWSVACSATGWPQPFAPLDRVASTRATRRAVRSK